MKYKYRGICIVFVDRAKQIPLQLYGLIGKKFFDQLQQLISWVKKCELKIQERIKLRTLITILESKFFALYGEQAVYL